MSQIQLPQIDTLCFFCTADPPTLGHTYVLEVALQAFPELKKTLVIPPLHHVWDKQTAPFADRLAMAHLAFNFDSRLEVVDIEKNSNLSGYTVDTLTLLRQENPTSKLGLLVGLDTLLVFDQWNAWEKILDMAPLFVVSREEIGGTSESPSQSIQALYGQKIFFLPTSFDVRQRYASTSVRRDIVVHKHSVQVIPSVADYIRTHALYQGV